MATPRAELAALAATDIREPIPMEVLLPVITAPPFVPTRSLINIRDVGASPGSGLPTGRMFRCGTLGPASKDPEALAWLGANVKRIFDLRTPEERQHEPDPEIPGVENIWFEAQGQYPGPDVTAFVKNDGNDAWRDQYMAIARIFRPSYRAVLEHVRDRPEEPFLFHCTAGRDRTGVLAGLLNSLAGTAPDDITLDYMLSRIGTEPAREKLLQYAMAGVGITDVTTPGFFNLVDLRPAFWNAFLEGLQEEFGDWDGYVTKGLGFEEEDLAKIKTNLRS